MTLRARLTGFFSLLFGGLIIPFAVFLYLFLGSWLRSELKEQTLHDLEQILVVFNEHDQMKNVTEELYREEADEFEIQIRLLDSDGKLLFQSYGFEQRQFGFENERTDTLGHRSWLQARLGDEPHLVLREPFEYRNTRYVCEIWKSQSEVLAILRQLLVILAIGFPVILLSSVAVGYLFARRALAPVEELRKTAEIIGSEDLSARLPVPASKDELHRLANTLNNLLARLEGAFESMKRFTADASHELRIPLTNIRGIIEVNLLKKRTAEEHEEDLRDALGEVHRLTELTTDLLLLARIDARKLEARRERIDLEKMLREAFEDAQRLSDHRTFSLDIDNAAGVFITGDENRLRQLLIILLDNAVKYSADESLISLSTQTSTEDVTISVADNGEGIATEDREKIFERFYRVDKSRSREDGGTGLGLAIARSIVESHGGQIWVDSHAGAGSTFHIRLPIR